MTSAGATSRMDEIFGDLDAAFRFTELSVENTGGASPFAQRQPADLVLSSLVSDGSPGAVGDPLAFSRIPHCVDQFLLLFKALVGVHLTKELYHTSHLCTTTCQGSFTVNSLLFQRDYFPLCSIT